MFSRLLAQNSTFIATVKYEASVTLSLIIKREYIDLSNVFSLRYTHNTTNTTKY